MLARFPSGEERNHKMSHPVTVRAHHDNQRAIEAKWRTVWEQTRLYEVDLRHAEHPYYNLMMFPYPSAEGLHVGNLYAFVGSDIHGRLMAMQGQDVFEPIGFDAFGIHSENFAITQGIHPKVLTARNVERFRETQLKRSQQLYEEEVSSLLPMLAPLAPFITEELWERLGKPYSIHRQRFPHADPALLGGEIVTVAVQINGRTRATIELPSDAEQEEAVQVAKRVPALRRYLDDVSIRRVVYVPRRILNLVT
jgi:leucyl-tRNA synthetase